MWDMLACINYLLGKFSPDKTHSFLLATLGTSIRENGSGFNTSWISSPL